MATLVTFDRGRVGSITDSTTLDTDFDPSIAWCNVAGTITVQPAGNTDGTTSTFTVAAGQMIPVLITKITAVTTMTISDVVLIQ